MEVCVAPRARILSSSRDALMGVSILRSLLFLILAFPTIASAQMVRGTVTDAATGGPIKTASVTLFTTDGRRVGNVVSDEDGKFEMVLPKGKTVYVQAARIGYETAKSDPITATTSELLELNVRLSTAAIPLKSIEVVTRRQVDPRLRDFMDRASLYKRAGIGHIWTRKELEGRPLALVSQIRNWVIQRRAMNCQGVAAFIDDMPVDAQDMDLLVAPEELEGVELYGEMDLPLELQSKVTVSLHNDGMLPPCQTILLWRKPYAELNAFYAAHPVKTWRAIVGAAVLVGLVAAEQILVGGRH